MIKRAAAFFLVLLMSSEALAEDGLPSVVSLDYCADQYVLALADPEQIKGLSRESQMAHSFYRDRAAGLPQIGASVEEVVGLSPDVVVTTWGGGPRLFSVLRSRGVTVVRVPYESSVEQVAENLDLVAGSFGQSARGVEAAEGLLARRARLEALAPLPLVAAYLTPGGVTAGRGTTVDLTLRLAGFQTLGDELALDGWPDFPLEQTLATPPDVIVTGFYDQPSAVEAHWSLARHASVRHMLASQMRVDVPGRYLSCNGLFIVDAAEFIRSKMHLPMAQKAEEDS